MLERVEPYSDMESCSSHAEWSIPPKSTVSPVRVKKRLGQEEKKAPRRIRMSSLRLRSLVDHRSSRLVSSTFQYITTISRPVWRLILQIVLYMGLFMGIPLATPAGHQRRQSTHKINVHNGHSSNSGHHCNRKVHLYRKIPLRAVSRLWGKANNVELPNWLRKPTLGLYIWMFSCNLKEAAVEDLQYYRNLGEFFRRQLKPGVRNIDKVHSITSPADGRILYHGVVENDRLEQVKGVTYRLSSFLGLPSSVHTEADAGADQDGVMSYLRVKPDHRLYHCVIYLAPGDYHRFHSPAKWTIQNRKHFPGDLLSVSPNVARWVQGLFNFNERVVYCGQWKHGFFSMTAVGATNVGSIRIYIDDKLKTNTVRPYSDGVHFDRTFVDENNNGIPVKKGELFGEFNLGSTIVLVFEAPTNFNFKVESGEKIQFGEPLGCHKGCHLPSS